MTKLNFGDGYDHSTSSITIDTDGGSGLEVNGGARHDYARQDVVVHHDEKKSSGSARVWAVGSFFVIGVVVLVAVIGAAAHFMSPVTLVVVIGAALLCMYLVALFLVPRENAGGVAGFGKLLGDYLKLIAGKA